MPLQVSWRPPSCHRVIFPLTLMIAPVNSVRTEKRRQAWEKAKRKKEKEKKLCEPQKDWVLCLYSLASGEQVCLSLCSQWEMEVSPLYGTLKELHHHYISLHYIIYHYIIHLLITERCRNVQFISINLINASVDSIRSIFESFHSFWTYANLSKRGLGQLIFKRHFYYYFIDKHQYFCLQKVG